MTTIDPLRASDVAAVTRLDALLTGHRKAAYWTSVFRHVVGPDASRGQVALAARDGTRLTGYLLGDVRAFEFGSPPCGWIVAVGVDPAEAHHGIGSALVAEAGRRFRRARVAAVRTMVRKNDVSLLAFFRSNGFVGGTYTQLELHLGPGDAPAAPPPAPRAPAPPRRR